MLSAQADIDDAFSGKMIMCDGCPHSYHMSCLKLTIEPDDEKWFCPDCNPSGFNTDEIRRLGRGAVAPRRGDQANSSTCYVCQRPGKLLGCDFCVNSFHPSCLVDVDWSAIGDEWECPVCRGFDPLANQMHKRWTRQEMEAKRKEREKNYQKFRSKIIKYRNRFLLVHQKDLGPFVNPKILQALARTLRGTSVGTLELLPAAAPSGLPPRLGCAEASMSRRRFLSLFSFSNVGPDFVEARRARRGLRFSTFSRAFFKRHFGSARRRGCGGGRQVHSPSLPRLSSRVGKADRRPSSARRDFSEASPRRRRRLAAALLLDGRCNSGRRNGWAATGEQQPERKKRKSSSCGRGGLCREEWLRLSCVCAGLGKTIQTLCFLSYLSAMRVEGPHLIVVPLSTVGNWLREIHSFTPNLTHIKICGSRNERQHAMQDRRERSARQLVQRLSTASEFARVALKR